MKTNLPKKSIPAALLLAGVCGLASTTANAALYAVSYNNLFDIAVNGNPSVPLADFNSFNATSAASANWRGAGQTGSDQQGGPADAAIAIGTGSNFGGPAPVNNAMNDVGQNGTTYSYSDSQISQTVLMRDENTGDISLSGNTTGQAWGIAEGSVVTVGGADASTRNALETGFDSTITLDDATTFSFSFKAAPYLFVQMLPLSVGVFTNAELSVIFTITDKSTGTTVFRWAPDGAVGGGGDIGVNDETDQYSLNAAVELISVGTALYDPTGSGAPNGTINPAAFGTYSATTNLLAAGAYTISLDMVENINMRARHPGLPVPGVLPLVGLGLLGLGFSRRRK